MRREEIDIITVNGLNMKERYNLIAFMLFVPNIHCVRPHHVESTGSRPITEVKQRRAWSVLGWVTAWEYQVSYIFFVFSYSFTLCPTITPPFPHKNPSQKVKKKKKKWKKKHTHTHKMKKKKKKKKRGISTIVCLLVGRSWRYCNTRPTRGESGASPWHLTSDQKSV